MATTYNTIQGDTFDLIALKTMGDEAYTGQLIDANPAQADTVIFSAGVKLAIPGVPIPSVADNLPPWRRGI